MPVVLVAGDRDEKFLALSERVAAMLPEGILTVLPGGHRLPLENPEGVARVLEDLDAEPGG
jgi:pimeloyl-ACP methyl ester carboxylesterase